MKAVRSKILSVVRNIVGTTALNDRVTGLFEQFEKIGELKKQISLLSVNSEDRERDIIDLLLGQKTLNQCPARIRTDHPIAIASDDYKFPRGTSSDNTRHPRFVQATEKWFGHKIKHLDLGCAGGGLVWDFLLNGHQSYGIEGSDYSLLEQRSEWRILKQNLFTADITKPFVLEDATGNPIKFDLITAWEVLEHIPENVLDGLIKNIADNLTPNGVFVASVAFFEDKDTTTGAVWHVTLKPKDWWQNRFKSFGLLAEKTSYSSPDYVRGSDNPRAVWDWNASTAPHMGVHLVMRKSGMA